MAHLGKYRIIQQIAAGGMAQLFLAESEGPMGFRKKVVLKRLHHNLARESEAVRMFLTEAHIAGQLNHPNIVHLYDLFRADDALVIAMEFVDGRDLEALGALAKALEVFSNLNTE